MKRPVLWIFSCIAAGLLAGWYLRGSAVTVLFFMGLSLFLFYAFIRTSIIQCLLIAVFMVSAFYTAPHCLQPKNNRVEELALTQAWVTVTGIVDTITLTSDGREQVTLTTRSISYEDEVIYEKLKISMLLEAGEKTFLGGIFTVKAKLLHFEEANNPGDFQEKIYRRARGYDYKMYPGQVQYMEEEGLSFDSFFARAREYINTIIDELLPTDVSGISKALLTGSKEYMSEDIKMLYTESGIAHLLAVSGLHISILTMILFYPLHTMFGINRRKTAVIVIIVLCVYLLLIASPPSAMRAVIMAVTKLIGVIFLKDDEEFNTVGVSAIVILCYQPLYLLDIGFQLSYVTILGIIAANKMISKLEKGNRIFMQSILISFTAVAASIPVTSYHFKYISTMGILTNLLCLPFMIIVICVLIAAIFMHVVWLFAAVYMSGIVYVILKFYEIVSVFITSLPLSYINVGSPSLVAIAFFYGALIFIYNDFFAKKCRRIIFTLLILAMLTALNFNSLFQICDITILDVGQGDCTVIRDANGFTAVVDTGGWPFAEKGANTGEKVVLAYLEFIGENEIDILFITHPDKDHMWGALELLERGVVKSVVISEYPFEKTDAYCEFLETVFKMKIPLSTMVAGNSITVGEGIVFECLYPYANEPLGSNGDNNGSLVLKVTIGKTTVLLTGDAQSEDEYRMLTEGGSKEGGALKSDILKLGHHGSKSSTSDAFLEAVSPKVAIASAGINNQYNHPSVEVIEKLQAQNIEFYQTAMDGAIHIKIGKHTYFISRQKGGLLHEGNEKANKGKEDG